MTDSDLLMTIAAHGLPGTTRLLPATPLEPAAWPELMAGVQSHGLIGLLAGAVGAGAFGVTDGQASEVLDTHRASMDHALRLEQLLLDTVAAFRTEGIDCRVLKGPAAAHLDYPDPAMRAFRDVDLLVAPTDWPAAVALLSRSCSRDWPELRPRFDERFGKAATFRTGAMLEIDLHRTFVDGRFGLTVVLADLFAARESMRLADEEVHALGPIERFLSACFHAAIGGRQPRLISVRDVAQSLLGGDLDTDLVLGRARSWQAEPVLARAVALTRETLALPPTALCGWAGRYRPSPADQRALRAYTSDRSSWTAQALAGVRTVPGVGAKAAYLRAILRPNPHVFRERGTTRTGQWRQRASRRARRDQA